MKSAAIIVALAFLAAAPARAEHEDIKQALQLCHKHENRNAALGYESGWEKCVDVVATWKTIVDQRLDEKKNNEKQQLDGLLPKIGVK